MDLLPEVSVTKVFDFGNDVPSVCIFQRYRPTLCACLPAFYCVARGHTLKVRLYVRLSCHEAYRVLSGMRVIPGELALC